MNTAYTLLLIAAALATVDSTTLRGSPIEAQERRQLLDESTCTLYKKCVTYPPTEEHPNGYHKDSWVCHLSEEDATRMNAEFVDIVETEMVSQRISHAISGETQLTVSEAIVDADSPRMYIPSSARVVVEDPSALAARTETRRNLSNRPSKTGTLKTLVIRVKDKNNVAPTMSAAKLKNDVFDDSVSLKTQSNACSYGKLKIEPFVGKTPLNKHVSDGITEIKMDFDIKSDNDGMDQAAMKAAKEQLGDLNDPRFDLVMFCFPPGRNFLAFAYPNSKYSFYNDQWCGFVSAQMHEIGHNIGLGHSGQVGEGDYGDSSGVMGSAPGKDDIRMCYNAQKNYQLGWYENKAESINPLDRSRYEFTLNGVSDYKRNNNALLALRLEQPTKGQDFYIGFNSATGITSDTKESRNMVTLIRKETGGPDEYSQSSKVASLLPGQRSVIKSFDGKKDISIIFSGLRNGDARIVITDDIKETLTQPKSHCKKFTIEVNTDDYPEDTSWFIVDNSDWGRAAAASQTYTNNFRKYRQEICLPMGPQAKTYKFTILDSYKDGIRNGSYKAFDSNNRLLFSGGGKDLVEREHTIQVPRDPNPAPPTRPPTPAPTAKPTPEPPCKKFIVEVNTDDFPGDSSWKFVGENRAVVAESQKHEEPQKKYTQQVCLSEGKNFDFQFLDSYGDGICCGKGEGFYRITDSCGNVIIDSNKKDEDFAKKSHTITVKECVAVTTQGVNNQQNINTQNDKLKKKCKDIKGRIEIMTKNKLKKKGCRKLSEKGKCNQTTYSGNLVSNFCPKSCGTCSN